MTKTPNTDGQISSVTVTIGSGPLSELVKKDIDAMATSKDCARTSATISVDGLTDRISTQKWFTSKIS